MKQILNIFRKDVRHHWLLILLCQAALVVYCWDEVSSWSEPTFGRNGTSSSLISLLLFLTWFLLIFRMVHDEPLVGDCQFWITRPYEWQKLLAEKMLLVLIFITLPLLIAGAFLLAKAGFSPAPYSLGLFWMQLLLFQLPFLPLLALGAVTRNLTQGILTLLAIFLVILIVSAAPLYSQRGVAHYYGLYAASSGFPSFGEPVGLMLLFACLVVIALQYARRKTSQSRIWLAGGVVAMFIFSLVSGYAKRNSDPFPVPEHQTIPFRAGLRPGNYDRPKMPPQQDQPVAIGIPVSISGIPMNSLARIRGVRLVLEAPDGYRWNASSANTGQLLQPGENLWRPSIAMDYEDYKRLQSGPLKAHVTVSADVYREGNFEIVRATEGEFDVPGVGRCRVMGVWKDMLRCHSPLAPPAMVVARVNPALSPCPDEPAVQRGLVYGLPYAWTRRYDSGPAQYGVSPVAVSFFLFSQFSDLVSICPGTQLVFSFPEFAENVRSEFEIPDFPLDNYRRPDFGSDDVIRRADGIRVGLPPR